MKALDFGVKIFWFLSINLMLFIMVCNFNSDFPKGCEVFEGPHSVECYESIWQDSGCLEEGYDYPLQLEDWQLNEMDLLTLTYVTLRQFLLAYWLL